jgi:ABC-type antimicrobial peptide transport system permease subunit
MPLAQFVVRSPSDPGRLANGIRTAVQAVDTAEPLSDVRTMSDTVEASLAPRRFVVSLLGVFAGLALLMAALGLYGVIGYSVSRRTAEIGIRLALGAQPYEVMAPVMGQGLRLAGMGAALGLTASIAMSRLLRGQLFRVSEPLRSPGLRGGDRGAAGHRGACDLHPRAARRVRRSRRRGAIRVTFVYSEPSEYGVNFAKPGSARLFRD